MLHSKVRQAFESPMVGDTVPADHYVSEEFLRLENEKVWPNVWHVACREEDLPEPGSYYVYDFLNESVLLIRMKDQSIKAFHNVCKHRGRQLLDGCGHATTIRCRFHGWRWNIDGTIADVLDREGWGDALTDEDLHLNELHVGIWEGFVFINQAETPEPFEEYLSPVPELFSHFEFGKMRYERWRTYDLECNWKVALEAFNEAYHIAGTHTQMLKFFDDRTASSAHGKHAVVKAPEDEGGIRPLGRRSTRMRNADEVVDSRRLVVDLYKSMAVDLGGTYPHRDAEAAHRLLTELPPDASPVEVQNMFIKVRREASEAVGAGWPSATPEQLKKGGLIWHLFPNMVLNPTFNASLMYRSRPHPTDPNKCELDVIFLRRYAPGAEPKIDRKRIPDWRAVMDDTALIVSQDFSNVAQVQKGMRSSGFEGARPSLVQEIPVLHFHRVLRDYMSA